jgi:hypothetical protein
MTDVPTAPDGLTVAAYTFPAWHPSELQRRQLAPGWTEYELMRGGKPWFEGHEQPRKPLLGELDESRPETWERYNALAAEFGVDVLIWDWYWYGGEPALHEALEDGFLRSANRDDVRFAVMWTMHPWPTWFPTTTAEDRCVWPVGQPSSDSREDAWRSFSYLMARYLHLPNYWRIDGKPVVVIWDTIRLLAQFGVDGTRQLLEDLRAHARRMGHPGIHFHNNTTFALFRTRAGARESIGDIAALGFDSYGIYTPFVLAGPKRPLEEEIPDYATVAADVAEQLWPDLEAASPLPFFPGVGVGWDASPRERRRPRTVEGDRTQWPASLILTGDSPAAFQAHLRDAFAHVQRHPADTPPVITIACWNEWTEGHYLLPDTRFGYGMLHALAQARGLPDEGKYFQNIDEIAGFGAASVELP